MLCPDASTNLGPSLQCDLKKIQSQKSSLKILEKKTYAAGKLASAKTISSPWPILAKVWSKSGDKMTGIPFKRPIFSILVFSAGVFIFGFATQWLFTYSRNLPITSSDFTTEAKIQYEYSIHSIKDNLSNFVNFFQFYCFSFLLLSFHFINFWSNSVRRFLRFFRQKIFNHIADCFVVFDTILFSDSCIFLFVSHTFNLITKAYPPIRKRYHPRFKKWWIYDILSSFDRFRFWKRFSNKWKSLQMAARIKGKMERTSSWSYLCRRIGFLTAAPRVVQPRRIAAQDWLSHSKLSISRQSQNNSFPLKVYTSVASSKII